MKCKKILGAGLLVFAIQFTIIAIFSSVVGPLLPKTQSEYMSYILQIITLLITATVVYFVSNWYFAFNKASIKNGAILGVSMVFINTVLVFLPVVPIIILLGKNGLPRVTQDMQTYLTSLSFLSASTVMILTAMTTAYLKQRTSASNAKDAIGSCMPKTEEV